MLERLNCERNTMILLEGKVGKYMTSRQGTKFGVGYIEQNTSRVNQKEKDTYNYITINTSKHQNKPQKVKNIMDLKEMYVTYITVQRSVFEYIKVEIDNKNTNNSTEKKDKIS